MLGQNVAIYMFSMVKLKNSEIFLVKKIWQIPSLHRSVLVFIMFCMSRICIQAEDESKLVWIVHNH